MARKSKLTESQWLDVQRRHLGGEKIRRLAREFGVGESTIRDRISAQCAEIKTVAHQMVTAEQRFNALPISAQISAQSLADDLRAISTHLAGAAKYGAMTAHRLSQMAHAETDKIDPTAPLGEGGAATVKTAAVLLGVANEAAKTGLNLLNANKDMARQDNDDVPSGLEHFYGADA